MNVNLTEFIIGAVGVLALIYLATKYFVIPRQRRNEDRKNHLLRRLG